MQNRLKKRKVTRRRRVFRVRKKLKCTAQKPRMSVYKSNRNMSVQIIDDEQGITLAGLSTQSFDKAIKRAEAAKELGEKIAKMAQEKNITTVVFDRGRFKFHGLIAKLAEGAREAGLQF